MPGHDYENIYFNNGFTYIAGTDEAGRGPLAGPVAAACVMFEKDTIINGVNDSKKLSPSKREKLFDQIIQKCISYSIVFSDVEEIEKINILNATKAAMHKAALEIEPRPQVLLTDSVEIKGLSIVQVPIIKGDQKCFSIAAASILAKVARDRYMLEIHEKYPEYSFAKHKGYGTREHIEAIIKYGPCPVHRLSFLRNILK